MLRFPEQAPSAMPHGWARPRPVVPPVSPPPAEDVVLCAGTWGTTTGVLAATGGRIGFVSMLRGETQMWSAAIAQVLAVEEHVAGGRSDVVLLTAERDIVLTGVPRARAWAFCRHVRDHIRRSYRAS
jgi:hypothetical protein